MAAGALVDRADVQAGRAADAVQRLRARPGRPARWCGRCRAGRGGTPAGPSPGVTPVQSEVYGFIRSPVEERGSSWRIDLEVLASVGIDLLDAHDRDQRPRGSVRHMRPLPSDSTTQMVPVSATAKFAPLIADPAPRGTCSRRCARAPPRPAPRARRSGPRRRRSVRRNSSRISARFLWIAGTRMCDDRSPASWMISSARSVSVARDAGARRAPRSGRSRRWSST